MRAWEITIKDLRLILKDRGALYTLLALPVVFIAILGVSTGQLITTHDAAKLVKVGVVDDNQSELSDHVFRDLSTIGGLKVDKVTDRDEAMLRLQDGRSNVVVILGNDFDTKVEDLDLGDVFDTEHGKLSRGLSAMDMATSSVRTFLPCKCDATEISVELPILPPICPHNVSGEPPTRFGVQSWKKQRRTRS